MSTRRTLSRAALPLRQSLNGRPAYRNIAAAAIANRPLSSQSTFLPPWKPSTVSCARAPNLRTGQLHRRAQSSTSTPAPELYTDANPGRTALYDLHVELGGKMVPFGGYSMPVQYGDLSVSESHHWTREKASLFDVGHMVQYHVAGAGAQAFLESLTPAALRDLAPGQSTLSALLHPRTGGIVDDCIITRLDATDGDNLFYLVANAGCRAKDYAFLRAALAAWDAAGHPPVQLRHLQSDAGAPFGLLALQGPLAAEILAGTLAPSCRVDVGAWFFGESRVLTLALPAGGESSPVVAARAGYTGEDGFELSVAPAETVAVARQLLAVGGEARLRMAGLGARDSLRLEAGMCLYGHDIDDTTTPVEAGLAWIIPKARRTAADAGFNGAETILPQLTPASKGGKGVQRRRVGLVVEGAPAREGAEIVDGEGQVVGRVTSGCPSPTLKKNIAMGYVRDGLHKSGTEVQVVVRGKKRKAVVTKMPFVPNKYIKPV